MFLNLNPATVGLDGVDLPRIATAAAKYGFDGIDCPAHRMGSVSEALAAKRMVEDAGLKWGLFSLPCDFLQADEDGFRRGIADLESLLPIVEAAGCRRAYNHVWPGSNERPYVENYEWHVRRLRLLCATLETAGVRLGIEFIGPKTLQDTFRHPFIRSATEAAALVDASDCGLGIVVDLFHWFTSGGSLAALRDALTGRYIVNVHANDATGGRTRDEQLDLERQMPLATGMIDACAVLRLISDLRYDGPVIAEPFNPSREVFRRMPVDDVLEKVGKSMSSLFAKSGIRNR